VYKRKSEVANSNRFRKNVRCGSQRERKWGKEEGTPHVYIPDHPAGITHHAE
jgi:hypothetical protein